MEIRHQLPAYSPITAKASLRAIAQALHLGDDSRPLLRALLEREYEAKSVLLCGSGTQALTIAIREARMRVDPSSPVALPAFSCFDVATAAVGADVGIMLYDLDPDTLAPDVESLESVLRAGAGAVVIAPLYGLPVDWSELSTLANQYNAVLVEDAAQGNGATWRGRRLGTLGEISILSFGRGKGWTGGNGGVVITRDGSAPGLSDDAAPKGFQGISAAIGIVAQWALGRPTLYGVPLSLPGLALGQTTYRDPVRPTSITQSAAAALVVTHEASLWEADARRVNAKKMLNEIADNSHVRTMTVIPESVAGFLRLPVRVSRGMASFESQTRASGLGIAPSYPRTLAELPHVSSRLKSKERVWPGANTLVRELVTIPTHSKLKPRELLEIADLLTGIEC